MKNLLLILALLVSTIGFSQVQRYEVSNSNINNAKKLWYKNREDKKENKEDFFASLYRGIQGMEFVVTPEMYNSTKDTNLLSVEFIQDSTHFYEDFAFFQNSCTVFDKNYSIGYVMDYMVDKDNVGLYIKKNYKDKSSKIIYIKMHLDYVIYFYPKEYEKIFQEPIINSYYEYQDDIDY